ncbi:MAG: FecR domain-containing protein [Candidatus Aquirickettsiella gammari]
MQHIINKILVGLFALSCSLGMVSSSAAADLAGSAVVVIGEANVANASKESHPIARGEKIFAGQFISTGANGHVILKMIDGASVIVRASSRLFIEEYYVDTVTPSKSRIKLNLENGVVRSITGKAGEASKESYRLNTPLAAIGIRGTDFVVQANQEVTRVTVQSGAIVMTRFGVDCSREALGPCKSTTSRDLTAAMRNAYLELRSRSETPIFVPADKATDSPNLIAPPRQEEPKVGADKTKAAADSMGSDATRSLTSNNLNQVIGGSGAKPDGGDNKPAQLPVIPQQIWWGRWDAYTADGQSVISQLRVNKEIGASNPVFGLYREPAESYALPSSGVVGFKLADSESYLMNADKTLSKASISASNLTIDFGNRRYDTALTVNAPDASGVQIQSQGSITFQGYFISELNSPNTMLDGSLNRDGSQAGYLFQRQLSNGTSVVGATRWTK